MRKAGFRKQLFEVESKEPQKKNRKQEDVELVEVSKKRSGRPKKNTLVHTTKKESPKFVTKVEESKKISSRKEKYRNFKTG